MHTSLDMLKNSVDTMGVAFAVLEPQIGQNGATHDFSVVYMNAAAHKITRVPADSDETSFLRLTGLEKESRLFTLLVGVVTSRQAKNLSTRLNLWGGGISDELYDLLCAPCESGVVITVQKAAQQKKQTRYPALEIFKDWAECFSLFEVVTHEDGREDLRVLAANKAFAKLIAHDHSTLPGKLFSETCIPGITWLPFYIETAKKGVSSIHESYNYDLKIYLSAVQFSPAIGQVVLIVLDRTQFWKKQQAMERRREDVSRLFSSMASGFCVGKLIRDEEGMVVDAVLEMVNPAFEILEGFPTSTMQGKRMSALWRDNPCLDRYIQVVEAQNKVTFTKNVPSTGRTLEAVCFSFGDDVFSCVENDVTARIKAEQELAKSQAELAEKHRIIMSSIDYASRIQRNLLPQEDVFNHAFSDHAVIWNPRDIVGGDIYWLKNFEGGSVLCVCDCTGHGTPGAFLTMLVVSAFEAIVNENNWMDTQNIIWQLEQRLVNVLNVHAAEEYQDASTCFDIKDGCDLAVLSVANDGGVAISSGNTHVFVCDGKEVLQLKGQKICVGEGRLTCKEDLQAVTVLARPAQKFYIASDGFFDQIGEAAHKPFGYHCFKQTILQYHAEKLEVVLKKLWAAFEGHRGKERRRDDVQLIAFQK